MKAPDTLVLVLVWNHPASTHEVRAARYVECRHNSNVEQESSLALSCPVLCLCVSRICVFGGKLIKCRVCNYCTRQWMESLQYTKENPTHTL